MKSRRRSLFSLAVVVALAFSAVPSAAPATSSPVVPSPLSAAAPHDTWHPPNGPESNSATTSVIVGYAKRDRADALASVGDLGGRVSRQGKSGRIAKLSVPPGVDVNRFIARLESMPGVEYAQRNRSVHALFTSSNDPGFRDQWSMPKVGANYAWDRSRGASITVAVLDTGVDISHPDLAGRIDTAHDWDFVWNDSVAQDDDGHGTHVSGIIAADLNNGIGVSGIAPKATILPLKVLDAQGNGDFFTLADGLYYATDNGAQVINMSLGSDVLQTDSGADVEAVASAVAYAVSHDVVVVAAAGNDGIGVVTFPGWLPNVVTVSSTNSRDALSSFSSYGPEVDIAAPGSLILSTYLNGSYEYLSGTSMATPLVAGTVALIRSKHPSWNRATVEAKLYASAKDLGSAGKDRYFGYGRVNAALSAFDPAPDDDIPGVPLTSSVTDSLTAGTYGFDTHDVRSISLDAGQHFFASLTGASVQMRLLRPGTSGVESATVSDVVAASDATRRLFGTAPVSGVYYLDVYTSSASGAYSLSYGLPSSQASVIVTAPQTITYGASANVSGRVTSDGGIMQPATVDLYQAAPGTTDWSLLTTMRTDEGGAFSFSVSPSSRRQYRVGVLADQTLLPAESDGVTITPHAYVRTPVAPTTMYRSRYYTIYGHIKPKHPAGSHPVRIYRWRKVSGVWKSYGYVKAVVSDYSTYSKYSARMRLSTAGKWRVRAYAPEDSAHAATWSSGYDYVTVK